MKKSSFFTAAMMFAFIPLIFAVPGGPDMGTGHDIMMDKGFKRALEGLNLTQEQEKALQDIQGANKREIMKLKHEIQLAILDIQEEYKKEKSDEAKINSAIDRLADAQKKMMKLRSAQMLKMKAVLTPGQFQKLTAKLDKAKEKMKKGFWGKPGAGNK